MVSEWKVGPMILLALVGIAALAGWALTRALKTGRADYGRAKTEFSTRRQQLRLLAVGVAGLAAVGLLAALGLSGVLGVRRFGAPAVAESFAPAVCESDNTGRLSLVRTDATTIRWTYAHADADDVDLGRLTVLVDRKRVVAVVATGGEVTVTAAPVRVTVQGGGPGSRVHATCVG
ncbi:hypothetical protein [Longispora fulva]